MLTIAFIINELPSVKIKFLTWSKIPTPVIYSASNQENAQNVYTEYYSSIVGNVFKKCKQYWHTNWQAILILHKHSLFIFIFIDINRGPLEVLWYM